MFVGRAQSGEAMKIKHPPDVPGESQPISRLQGLIRRNGGEASAVAFDLDEEHSLEVSKPCIGDRAPGQRAPGGDHHFHDELARLTRQLFARSTPWREDARREDDHREAAPNGDWEADLRDLE